MLKHSIRRLFGQNFSKWLLAFAFMNCMSFVAVGPAFAQAEPTMNQIYQAAQAGKLDQAQVMIQQVLIARPNSAKAHFVQAELFARQGLASRGREALGTAERLAPGLPFAKPEAVQALRAQLASKPGQGGAKESNDKNFALNTPTTATADVPMGLILLLGAGVIAVVVWLVRRKPAVSAVSAVSAASGLAPGVYANPSSMTESRGLNGPQSFGSGVAGNAGVAPAYAQPGAQAGFGQAPYGQPASIGMGGRVLGGLATGLAVGAGVMAAQAIGKNLMGNNEQGANPKDSGSGGSHEALAGNRDMGGENFGINDNASWDDAGGSADLGGGGDWDT